MNKPLIFNPLKYAFIIALGDPRGTSGKKTKSAKIKEFGELEINQMIFLILNCTLFFLNNFYLNDDFFTY
jgi:hypothetical protein